MGYMSYVARYCPKLIVYLSLPTSCLLAELQILSNIVEEEAGKVLNLFCESSHTKRRITLDVKPHISLTSTVVVRRVAQIPFLAIFSPHIIYCQF